MIRFRLKRLLPAALGLLLAAGISGAAVTDSNPLFKIPKLEKIKVDGNSADWGKHGFQVNLLTELSEAPAAADMHRDSIRIGWDNQGLLILARIPDATPVESDQLGRLFERDSVELYLGTKRGVNDFYQVVIAPGRGRNYPEIRTQYYDNRKSPDKKPLVTEVARTRIADGYVLEARLPWKNLSVQPEMGREVALQIHINDATYNQCRTRVWYPMPGAYSNPSRMNRLQLSTTASNPTGVAAYYSTSTKVNTQITTLALGSLHGKQVTLRNGNQVVSTAKLGASKNGFSQCWLALPENIIDPDTNSLSVQIEGESPVPVEVPNTRGEGIYMIYEMPVIFKPFVFSGESFPACDFQEPTLVEKTIGAYSIKCRFFDSEFNEVTLASKPGRYGAVVQITTKEGKTYNRFVTLFNTPKPCDWDTSVFKGSLEFPAELGLNPAVVKEQSPFMGEYFKEMVLSGFNMNPASAFYLATLYDTKPGEKLPTHWSKIAVKDSKWWLGLKKKIGIETEYKHFEFFPEGYSEQKDKKWPLLVMLHGAGERSNNPEKLRDHLFWNELLIKTKKEYPCIVTIPQCPFNEWWEPARVKDLIDQILAKYPIDPDRVYLSGLSMGGFGTWTTAGEYPELFAAIAPICGGGDVSDAANLKSIPIWAFHGDIDPVVSMNSSREMVDAVAALGGAPRLTIYPGTAHNAWGPTLADPRYYQWLLQQNRKNRIKPDTGYKLIEFKKPLRVASLRCSGDSDQLSAVWSKFNTWIDKTRQRQNLGLYFTVTQNTDSSEKKVIDACMTLTGDFTPSEDVFIQEIPAGVYAVRQQGGSPDQIGKLRKDLPTLEWYRDTPGTPEEKLPKDLCEPVELGF
jgi:DNA gyrase inhibitor GyrI/predicted esterase